MDESLSMPAASAGPVNPSQPFPKPNAGILLGTNVDVHELVFVSMAAQIDDFSGAVQKKITSLSNWSGIPWGQLWAHLTIKSNLLQLMSIRRPKVWMRFQTRWTPFMQHRRRLCSSVRSWTFLLTAKHPLLSRLVIFPMDSLTPHTASPGVASDGAGVGIPLLSSEGFSERLTPPNCLLTPITLPKFLLVNSTHLLWHWLVRLTWRANL